MKKFLLKSIFVLVILSVFNATVSAQEEMQPVDYLKMGYLLNQRGEYSQAIECFSNALKSNIEDKDVVYILRGVARVELKDYKGAINDFTSSIAINPKNYYAYASRAWLKAMNKDYKGALKDYTDAINLDSSKEYLYYERGKVRCILKDNTGALIDCTNSINTNPNFDAYTLRAALRYELEDYEGAVKDFSAAIKIKNDIDQLFYDRACAYNHLKQYKLAIKDFDKAVKINPRYADAYFSRGLTKGMNKQYKECLADLEKAKDLFLEQNDLTKYEEVKKFLNKLQEQE